MSTTLAFRTPVGGVAIPAGQSKQLGKVDVSPYAKSEWLLMSELAQAPASTCD
jgi:hypothetical protein